MIRQISFNGCLNAKTKMFGLSPYGLAVAVVFMGIAWSLMSMPFGIMATVPGYFSGKRLGSYWYNGSLQKLLYWNAPLSLILGGRKLPPSYNRKYR